MLLALMMSKARINVDYPMIVNVAGQQARMQSQQLMPFHLPLNSTCTYIQACQKLHPHHQPCNTHLPCCKLRYFQVHQCMYTTQTTFTMCMTCNMCVDRCLGAMMRLAQKVRYMLCFPTSSMSFPTHRLAPISRTTKAMWARTLILVNSRSQHPK